MAVLHLQQNHMEGADNFFVFLLPFREARDLTNYVYDLNKSAFQSFNRVPVSRYIVRHALS